MSVQTTRCSAKRVTCCTQAGATTATPSLHSLEARHDEVAEVPAEVTLDADAELLVLLLKLDGRSERSNRKTPELLRQLEDRTEQ